MEKTNKKSVLVTGATGFIGKHLVSNLLDAGLHVYALTRRDNRDQFLDKKIKILAGDITQVIEVPSDVTTIYHCAGVISNVDQMKSVNILGTQRIVEAALARNCRLIHLSSAGVIGISKENNIDESVECRPHNLYEQTKFEAEKIIQKNIGRGLKAQIIRPTIVFGVGRDPRKDSFLHLILSINHGRYRNISGRNGIYNIIHVNEVVRAMLVLDNDNLPNGGVYFINTPITFKDFSKVVKAEISGETGEVPNTPYWLAFGIATLFSAITVMTGKKMPLTFSRLNALTNQKIFSQKRLIEMTEYRPLCDVKDYLRQVCNEFIDLGLLDEKNESGLINL